MDSPFQSGAKSLNEALMNILTIKNMDMQKSQGALGAMLAVAQETGFTPDMLKQIGPLFKKAYGTELTGLPGTGAPQAPMGAQGPGDGGGLPWLQAVMQPQVTTGVQTQPQTQAQVPIKGKDTFSAFQKYPKLYEQLSALGTPPDRSAIFNQLAEQMKAEQGVDPRQVMGGKVRARLESETDKQWQEQARNYDYMKKSMVHDYFAAEQQNEMLEKREAGMEKRQAAREEASLAKQAALQEAIDKRRREHETWLEGLRYKMAEISSINSMNRQLQVEGMKEKREEKKQKISAEKQKAKALSEYRSKSQKLYTDYKSGKFGEGQESYDTYTSLRDNLENQFVPIFKEYNVPFMTSQESGADIKKMSESGRDPKLFGYIKQLKKKTSIEAIRKDFVKKYPDKNPADYGL